MFTRKTFEYFEAAEKNRRSLKWFGRHREDYEENVKAPFTGLLKELKEKSGHLFPEVSFSSQKVCLPVYRENFPEDGTLVKPFTWAFLSQKKTSIFEWNPGINLYFGDELTIGMGLYHPSSRQLKLLRQEFVRNPVRLQSILKNKKLSTAWGELQGEKFARFPAGLDAEGKGAEYLWFKQFILTRRLTRREFLSPALGQIIAHDLEAGAPFLRWLQETVGVYERPHEEAL